MFEKLKKEKQNTNILTNNISSNIDIFKKNYESDSTLITRPFSNKYIDCTSFCAISFDGVSDSSKVSNEIIKPITELFVSSSFNKMTPDDVFDFILNDTLISLEANAIVYASYKDSVKKEEKEKIGNKEVLDYGQIVSKLLYGDTLLMFDKLNYGIILSTKGWKARSIEEPPNEKIFKGPKEGFSESILTNISLVRRKLPTEHLKIEQMSIGRLTNTKIALCYLDNVVSGDALNILKARLKKIDIDSMLDANYIAELIKDNRKSPFKTIGTTERPDTLVGKILEGRIGVLTDLSPTALTVPYLFIEYFQSTDDYYLNYIYSSLTRLLRFISFLISISIPSIYLALVCFHTKMLPFSLLSSIADSKVGVPFPTLIEILFFLGMFEILREASVHMPPNINQALGVVGGLVVGQAAVDAKLISAPIVIIVALSGITGIMISSLKGPIMLLRLYLLIASFLLGLYGYTLGIASICITLFSMSSFGIPYIPLDEKFSLEGIKDTLIRLSWKDMIKRPSALSLNSIRQNVLIDSNKDDNNNSNNESNNQNYKVKDNISSKRNNSSTSSKAIDSLKKIFFLSITLVLTFVLTGCYNYQELTDKAVVIGATIDSDDGKLIRLTCEIASKSSNTSNNKGDEDKENKEEDEDDKNNKENKGKDDTKKDDKNSKYYVKLVKSNKNSIIVESSASSIYEAIEQMDSFLGRETYWNHSKVFVLSKDLTYHQYLRVVDCLMRNPPTSINTKLMIAETKKASDVITSDIIMSDYVFSSIYSNLLCAIHQKRTIDEELYQVANTATSKYTAIALPSINIYKDGNNNSSDNDKDKTKNKDDINIKTTKIALFDKDHKPYFLNYDECLYYMLLTSSGDKAIFSYNVDTIKSTNPNISFRLINPKTNIRFYKDNKGKLNLDFDIKMNLELIGAIDVASYLKGTNLSVLSKRSSSYLTQEITKFTSNMNKKLDYDYMNLHMLLLPRDAKVFSELELKNYKDIKFNINVDCKIVSTGSVIYELSDEDNTNSREHNKKNNKEKKYDR